MLQHHVNGEIKPAIQIRTTYSKNPGAPVLAFIPIAVFDRKVELYRRLEPEQKLSFTRHLKSTSMFVTNDPVID
jgi:hypothetical protein